jgi:hypothetical protein
MSKPIEVYKDAVRSSSNKSSGQYPLSEKPKVSISVFVVVYPINFFLYFLLGCLRVNQCLFGKSINRSGSY